MRGKQRLKRWRRNVAAANLVAAEEFARRAGVERTYEQQGFTRQIRPGTLASESGASTAALFARLGPALEAELERQVLAAEQFAGFAEDLRDPALRPRLLLHLGLALDVPGVAEATGLSRAEPPETVHAMSRGPLAAGGALYEADLVSDALLSAGVDLASVRTGLDFGSSSGRVVRVLAAAYPEVDWLACDPNAPAIEWASEHLAPVSFFVSGNEPPLDLADGSVDLVYAISIWSHFEPELGLRWFREMRRILAPGGHLIFTTHGPASVDFYASTRERRPGELGKIRTALYRYGRWYHAEFGERGDWGVVTPGWGTAFLSPEWVLANLCPDWRVLEFAPGRNHGNQDLYVLER